MATIPLPEPTEPDVYSFGFDKTLNRNVALGGSLVYNSVEDVVQGQSIQFGSLNVGAGDERFSVDMENGLWLGGENFADAPFSVDKEGNLIASSVTITGDVIAGKADFGGDGTDGELNVTGTTTVDLENKLLKVLNYTSLNVATGATLNFSNPNEQGTVIVIKSQGDIDVIGTTDASGMGAEGGDGGTGNQGFGTVGKDSDILLDTDDHFGKVGGPGHQAAGAAGDQIDNTVAIAGYSIVNTQVTFMQAKYRVAPGAGGGGGNNPEQNFVTAAGDGGPGGPALIIECAGKWNFTGTITVAGGAGGSPTGSGSGGGGGGSGGHLLVLYNELTASSGTATVDAGAGGGVAAYDSNTGNGGGGGGGGGHIDSAGTNGTIGVTNGIGGVGGAGVAGKSLIVQNVWLP